MSDLSFDVNGYPLPEPKPSRKKSSSAGIRLIRTPSPSNLATTTVTHKRRSSSSASSRSSDKSIHLVTGPTGTVVGDLQKDTVSTIDRVTSTTTNRHTSARTGSSSSDISTGSTRSYRINKDRKTSRAQHLRSDAADKAINTDLKRRRSNDSVRKSAKLVGDSTGPVVEDLKADTTSFDHSSPKRGRHRDRRSSQHSPSNSDDLQFDANGDIVGANAKHHHQEHHRSRSSRSRCPEYRKNSEAPLFRPGPSSPVALYDAVFGDDSEPVRTDERGSSSSPSSSATSISSGYIEDAGGSRRNCRRGRQA